MKTKYNYHYTEKLAEMVIERLPEPMLLAMQHGGKGDFPFILGLEEMTGTIWLTFPGGMQAYATPFWEDCQGIPVAAEHEGVSTSFELPFFKTGDLERDAAEYVRLCSLIPTIIGTQLSDQETVDIGDHEPEAHEDVEAEIQEAQNSGGEPEPDDREPEAACDCRQYRNLGRCDHTDAEPPEEPSGFTGMPPDYSKGDE